MNRLHVKGSEHEGFPRDPRARPVGAYRTRAAARTVALAAVQAGAKVTDHCWSHVDLTWGSGERAVLADGGSDDRVELLCKIARRWVNSGYMIDSTDLHD